MNDPIIFWTKFGAIAQALGAVGTFLAVVTSLYLAISNGRPRLRLRIGERTIIGDGVEYPRLLMFEVANAGDRPVQIRGLSWETGWLRWGPSPIKRIKAIQFTGHVGIQCADPPYQVEPGMSVASYAILDNVLVYARERKLSPLFSRDWPLIGRRKTRIRGYAYTADGFTIRISPEPTLVEMLVIAEKTANAQ